MPLSLLLVALLPHTGGNADTTLHVARGSSIEINSTNRGVTMHIGSGDVVIIRGAAAEVDGRTVQIGGDEAYDRSGYRNRSRTRPASSGGIIDITVPAWINAEIDVVTGDLVFDGSPATLHAETVNGNIRLAGGTGDVELSSVNGTITVNDFHGTALSLDANNDNVTVTNATGQLHVEAVSGAVRLRGIHSSDVDVSSIDGAVDFDGPLASDGKYNFESHNDGVTLYLPADVSARMKVSTFNGEFTSADIPGTTTGGRTATAVGGKGKNKGGDGEQEFTVTYGKGDARVTIDSFNGDITIKRGPAPRAHE